MMRSYDYIVDLFNRFDSAEPFHLDPAGTTALREAKRVRRAALRVGDEADVADKARTYFGLPATSLSYAAGLMEPLYPPARDTNN
jgi:hypothetical protein